MTVNITVVVVVVVVVSLIASYTVGTCTVVEISDACSCI